MATVDDIKLEEFTGDLITALSRLLTFTENNKRIYVLDVVFSQTEYKQWQVALYYKVAE